MKSVDLDPLGHPTTASSRRSCHLAKVLLGSLSSSTNLVLSLFIGLLLLQLLLEFCVSFLLSSLQLGVQLLVTVFEGAFLIMGLSFAQSIPLAARTCWS